MTEEDYVNMSSFSCGIDVLDDFFRYEVKECVEHKYLSAYCAVLHTGEIVAAFTLMNDALMIIGETEKADFIDDLKYDVEDNISDFFNRQTSYPAINIGHLGTSIHYQGHGIGKSIIDLVAMTYADFRQAGCQFITVDSLNNPRTNKFYLDNRFNYQTDRDFTSATRRMYRII